MTAAIDITTEQRKTLLALLRRFIPGVAVWAYGSRVKWAARPNSDLDLVAFTSPVQRHLVSELKDAIGESNLPFLVDLHVWDEVPERFYHIIRKEYVVLQEAQQLEKGLGMAGEWQITRLGDVVVINPDAIGRDWPYPHIRYIDISSVDEGQFRTSPEQIPLSEAPSRAKRLIHKGDTVLSTVRPNRRSMFFASQSDDDWVISTGFAVLRPDTSRIVPRYLYACVFNRAFTEYLITREKGAAYPAVSPDDIANAEIMLPPLVEQQTIACILGALDDKIELNRRMNETLEAMARAIFKSWFVDFDPIPGHGPHKEWQDTPLGRIPKGWRVAELGDITDVIDCLHSKKPERQQVGKALLQLWNIRDDGLIDMSDTYWIAEDDYNFWVSRIEASQGDCVVTNVGRVGAVAQIPQGLRAALGRNMTAIRCKKAFPYPTLLIECLLSSKMKEEILHKTDTGTILNALNVKNIPKLRFILPSPPIGELFEKACRPMRARMENNISESRILAAIRDALLPKLLSGELRVKDTERIVERCV